MIPVLEVGRAAHLFQCCPAELEHRGRSDEQRGGGRHLQPRDKGRTGHQP